MNNKSESYKAEFTGWDKLTLEDLLVAYRKAKADCFFENTFPSAIKFAEYEQDLLENLKALLEILQSEGSFTNNKELLGDYRLLPKKLTTKPKKSSHDSENNSGHVYFSNPEQAVKSLFENSEITPEFRVVGDFPVNSHIISALWINMIGHKLDSELDDSCYGVRLKRIRNDELFSEDEEKPFHLSAIGSFVPYYNPYKKWRSDGLNAIRDELEKDKDVIAVSLDLKSYYHFIDPTALASEDFMDALGVELTEEERVFTLRLAGFLENWSDGAAKFAKEITGSTKRIQGGLVIGLTVSRIISNALLHHWDRMIIEKLSPIHYGRYVDDMFLVLRDTSTIKNSNDFMGLLQERLGDKHVYLANKKDQLWAISQGEEIQKGTKISLQSNKQKLFILQGSAGLDLLDSIEKHIVELSSEHRMMPSPDQLEGSIAAKVLSAAETVAENADNLRRADGLTIRRLGLALQLKHVETLAHDLPAHEWKEQREDFYKFVHNHILRADNLFAQFPYLSRLLGFAISMGEWSHAEKIIMKSYKAIENLATKSQENKQVTINGSDFKVGVKENDNQWEEFWENLKATITWIFVDTITRYYNPEQLFLDEGKRKKEKISQMFFDNFSSELSEIEKLFGESFSLPNFEESAPLVALADLAKIPYKQLLKSKAAEKLVSMKSQKEERKIHSIFESSSLIDIEALKTFLNKSQAKRWENIPKGTKAKESTLPYLFPTRPLTPSDITELAPECVGLPLKSKSKNCQKPSEIWAKYTQAVRGVWIRPTILAAENDKTGDEDTKKKTSRFLNIGTEKKDKVVVALTNITTEDKDWVSTAYGKPNLSRKRYQRLSRIVNDTLKLRPKPDYVLFPELSIPLEWVDSIAAKLNRAGISMIASTEYRHLEASKIKSEVVLILSDNRLGYPAFSKIWQPKLLPAVGESEKLTSKFGKEWFYTEKEAFSLKNRKPVYIHNEFNFGVMVCSELQNTKARTSFQGAVDALMILSWNRDLDTFSSLIESSALDVHAYTILVNNRTYGDSRVRSPAKKSHLRDLARVKGGDNDFVIVATLDIASLRAFQSRARRIKREDDKFKPVPEGFKISKNRKTKPE